MKNNMLLIIQIGDKTYISRAFDIFITITIFSNIIWHLQTFDRLAFMGGF